MHHHLLTTAGALVLALAASSQAATPARVGKLKPDSAIVFASPAVGEKDSAGTAIVPEELFATSIDGKDVVQRS